MRQVVVPALPGGFICWEDAIDWLLKVFHRLVMPSEPFPSEAERSELIQAIAKAQDRSAFIALFEFYAPRIKAQAMRFGVDPGVAEDIAQDALLSVWQRASQFDPERGSASAWIFTIATNVRIDRARREKRIAAAAQSDMQDASTTASTADGELDVDRLHGLLMALPSDQRRIIELSFYSEVSHGEIASRLNIPLGTVKSRIRLAIVKLRQALRDTP